MILGIVVAAALLVGFLAGLVSFKKTNEYCDRHGVTRICPVCADGHPTAPAAQSSGMTRSNIAGRGTSGSGPLRTPVSSASRAAI
jgi:hypothetical protein